MSANARSAVDDWFQQSDDDEDHTATTTGGVDTRDAPTTSVIDASGSSNPGAPVLLGTFDDRCESGGAVAADSAASSRRPESTTRSAQLLSRLLDGSYDCAVCTELVSRNDRVWSCPTCFGVLHYSCMHYWAQSKREVSTAGERIGMSAAAAAAAAAAAGTLSGDRFRCPLCQQLHPAESIEKCRCYCGKAVDPRPSLDGAPGSCMDQCGKRRRDASCPHRCTLLCHPGPCVPCPLFRQQPCFCGATTRTVGCSSGDVGVSCGGSPCGKKLECGRHTCRRVCHDGPCATCEVTVSVTCHCGRQTRERPCSSSTSFCCETECGKKLSCGNHMCRLKCHVDPCPPCERSPSVQKSCACGAVPLWRLHHERPDMPVRSSCLDPIPSCCGPCGKPLPCGDHCCPLVCGHDPAPGVGSDAAPAASGCPPCGALVATSCRCGRSQNSHVPCFVRYLPMSQWEAAAELARNHETKSSGAATAEEDLLELLPASFPPLCARRCHAKKSCGRHSCEEVCCDGDHTCTLVCKKRAPCGVHTCDRRCHKGLCPPCDNLSFDPLYCACRKSVIDPPVPCGTPMPQCSHPCSLPRPCGHPASHCCHPPDVPCAPCVVRCAKRCASHNLPLEWHVACHLTAVSCGKACKKQCVNCGHMCAKICHGGHCEHRCTHLFPTLEGNRTDAGGAAASASSSRATQQH